MVSIIGVQKWTIHVNECARANTITTLTFELSNKKVEVVNVRAEAVISITKGDQKATTYLKSTATARVEMRRDLDRVSSSKGYAKCKSQRDMLEEIHAHAFDHSKEI